MNPPKKGIAIFDFDGTIIKKDSFIEFIRYTNGSMKLFSCYLVNCLFVILYFIKLYPNYKLKELFFTYFFKGISEEALRRAGAEFSAAKIDGFYHDFAKEILQWHRERGHEILILTASSELWMGEWCHRNGYMLMDTSFEVQNGLFTGKIKGKNCHGKEKERRIKKMIDSYDFEQTYGYGDSKSDLPFMKHTHQTHYGSLGQKREYRINTKRNL